MSKYTREITQTLPDEDQGFTIDVDVYDVLRAFAVTDPAIQHAVKKLLCTGIRGHKDTRQDLEEAIQSIERALDVVKTDEKLAGAMPESQPVTSDNPQESPACPFKVGDILQHKEHGLKCRVEQINGDNRIIWVRNLKNSEAFYIAKTGWKYYEPVSDNSPQPQECPFRVGDVIWHREDVRGRSEIKWKVTGFTANSVQVVSDDVYRSPSWIERQVWHRYTKVDQAAIDKPAATC